MYRLEVTGNRELPHLSVVNYGASWFVIWKELKRRMLQRLQAYLRIFLEREPINEILMNNSSVYQLETLKQLFTK